MTPDTISRQELQWRQYSLHVDLYKFYLEMVIKVNIFYYAVTGGILSFYFSKANDIPALRFSLLLPLVMSGVLGGIFAYGALNIQIVRDEVFSLAGELGFDTAPEMQVLKVTLWVFAVLFFLVALALGILICRPLA